MDDTERMRRRRRAAKRRRQKRIAVFVRNLCILALIITAAVIGMKFIVKPNENRGAASNQGSSASSPTAAESKTANDQSAASQKIIKYTFERPQIREGAVLQNRLLELNKKYPGFQDICDNMDKYPNDLLVALGNNPDMLEFVKGYLTQPHKVNGKITKEELQKEFPLFLQWDKRWGYAAYGDDIIALSGCAPTCISMVAAALTKNADATPDKVADYAQQNGYYQPNVGTAWSIMTEGAKTFGIRGEELSLSKNKIFNALENGNPVICSMRQGDFTASGHFIVLVGVKNGKLVINDPNSTIRSDMLWNYEDIEGQIKNLWVFYKM